MVRGAVRRSRGRRKVESFVFVWFTALLVPRHFLWDLALSLGRT